MCVFCKIINSEISSYKLYEDDICLAILDISQVTKGHTLVIPKEHFDNIYDIKDTVLAHCIKIAKSIAIMLKEKTDCIGINILNNNEEQAGQTVNHFHIHIIPRYHANDYIKIEFLKHGSINIEKTYRLLTEEEK